MQDDSGPPLSEAPQRVFEREILAELDAVLETRQFANADRLSTFLRFIVEQSLAGDRGSLKESVIGTRIYGRPIGYDPKSEPIVRTEARRLRIKLEESYSERQSRPAVRIVIPKGGYVAVFEPGESLAVAAAPGEPQAGAVAPTFPRARVRAVAGPRWRVWILLAAALGFAVLSGFLWFKRPKHTLAELVSTTVTSYEGYQVSPAPSPDGSEVAFSWSGEGGQNADIYVTMAAGGPPRRLTTDPAFDDCPGWAPDGSKISFIRGDHSLMVMNPLGGGEREIGTASFFTLWTPDSKQILHSDMLPSEGQFAIFLTDPETGAKRQLTFPPRGWTGDTYAALSPDGRQLAYTRYHSDNADIHITQMRNGVDRQVTHDGSLMRGLTWMPNGHGIVYAARRNGQLRLWKLDFSESGTPEPMPQSAEDVLSPRFAPHTSGPPRLFYVQRLRDTNIWRVETGGNAAPKRLIASTRLDSSPQISPDGRHIVFVSDRSGWDEIWLAESGGSNPIQLTRLRADEAGSPRWSADGRRILFDVHSKRGIAVFVLDLADHISRQWTDWGTAGRASWSRDGRWIYFAQQDIAKPNRPWQVCKISTGADRTVQFVTRDGGFEAYESMDGKTLFYTRGNELRRMPISGGSSSLFIDRPVSHGWWGVARDGVYFVDLYPGDPSRRIVSPGAKPVYRVNPFSGALTQVTSISGNVVWDTPDFCVSPDGKTLLYSLLEVSSAQIRMIEGFE